MILDHPLREAEDNYIAESFEAAKEKAREWAIVVQGDPHTLLLDLDSTDAQRQYDRVLPVVSKNFGVSERKRWLSKSGNVHVLLHSAAPLSVVERLVLQSALGSDGVREALGLWLFQNGVEEPSMLFRPRTASKGSDGDPYEGRLPG